MVDTIELDVGTSGQIFIINLDDVRIAYTRDFRIKFQQYDNSTWSVDERKFDNIGVALNNN